MKKGIIFSIIAAVSLTVIAGCASSPKHQAKEAKKIMKSIQYDSEPGGSLRINNLSGEDLVFFAGNILRNNILGGVRANQNGREFDLKKSLGGKLSGRGVFLLRAVRAPVYEERLAAGGNATNEDVVYYQVVSYDMNDDGKKSEYTVSTISGKGGAKEYLMLQNNSPYPVELRLDDPAGEVLLTLRPRQSNVKYYLSPDEENYGYQIWPTYITYNSRTGELNSVQGDVNDTRTVLPTLHGADVTIKSPRGDIFSSSIAYLKVTNHCGDGIYLIEGENGGQRKKSQDGIALINIGRTETFEFAAKEEGTFLPGLSIQIGRMGETLNLENAEGFKEQTLKAGFTYEAIIWNDNGVKRIRVTKPEKRDSSANGQMQLALEN